MKEPKAPKAVEGRFGLNTKAAWWDDPLPDPRNYGPSAYRWPVIAAVFLAPYLVPATRSMLEAGPLTADGLLVWLLIYGYAAFYMGFPVMFHRSSRPAKVIFGVVDLAFGLGVTAVTNASPFVLLYGTATMVFLLPAAWSVLLDGIALLIVIGLMAMRGRLGDTVGDLVSVASVTLAMFFMANLIRAIRRLELANKEIATLAVAGERERMARDLHDLLGHSLTTITVKAGLARRVLESSGDIPRAVQEIHEVEGLTRSALSDVRATVSEYREVSLSAELVGARAALRAAEIDADLPHAVDNVSPEFQHTFGYILRETVTNVLRHSGAAKVKVRLGRNWIEIEDDGQAGDVGEVVQGNGLRGLTERLAAIGGTLRTSVRAGGGLLVRAEVPEPEASTVTAAVRTEPAGGLA